MNIGVPREIKEMENRVGVTPAGVSELVREGHRVLVETNAGVGSGFIDNEYKEAGASIVDNASDIWKCEMVYKVKEPLADEYDYFRGDLLLFTYLHLAAEELLTNALMDSKTTSIAYETVQLNDSLPLLTPMSEVAGRMAVQVGARFLEKPQGGQGVLLGGVLCLACVFAVSNVTKLMVLGEREAILVMRLVGATGRYIRMTFLLGGCLIGGAGGVLAGVVLWMVAAWWTGWIPEIALLPFSQIVPLLILLGAVLGVLGSWTSLSRVLRVVTWR